MGALHQAVFQTVFLTVLQTVLQNMLQIALKKQAPLRRAGSASPCMSHTTKTQGTIRRTRGFPLFRNMNDLPGTRKSSGRFNPLLKSRQACNFRWRRERAGTWPTFVMMPVTERTPPVGSITKSIKQNECPHNSLFAIGLATKPNYTLRTA